MSFKFAFWAVAALVLFAAEAMAPGAFMLWFGFAAVAMAVIVLVAPGLGWLAQAVLFSVLALIAVAVYRTWFRGKGRQSDKPLLNRRAEQLVDTVAMLDQPIAGGRGRVKIDDAFWVVEGPELPAGTRVRVVAVNGMTLKVQEA
ncbi:NfeD family protein [Pseudoxanthomonas mexicana]|uniref:NfeD family protein n=1 Tax=Pseudoxanthomonas mexicana TaxID=128785 RepID=UPI00078219D6|nr:NfeD family protein [Pseudoxanthomonas mexicana]